MIPEWCMFVSGQSRLFICFATETPTQRTGWTFVGAHGLPANLRTLAADRSSVCVAVDIRGPVDSWGRLRFWGSSQKSIDWNHEAAAPWGKSPKRLRSLLRLGL